MTGLGAVSPMSKPWTSPNYSNRLPWTAKSHENGRRLAEATARWIEKNQSDFIAIYNIVKQMQHDGVKRRVREQVIARAMAKGVRFADGDFKFANSLWAGITRYLVVLDPSLAGNPIEFSQSDIDCYGLVPIELKRK